MSPRSALLQTRLDEVERAIRDLAVEHAYAFSVDGELLLHRTDDADSKVHFDDEAIALLPGTVLTHNHPGGRSFSETDVTFAMRVGLAEMRVVTARSRYVLRPPDDEWLWLLLKSFPAVLKVERHLLEWELHREILSGVRGQREADLAIHHLLWERLAGRGLINYSAIEW